MGVDQIKAEVRERWAEMPAAELSLRLIDFIDRLPPDQRAMLTYTTFMHASGKLKIDDELLAAITILVSSRVAALDLHGLLIDDDEREFPLNAEELAEAKELGELIHPLTGEPIPNFEEKIIPFFVPSARFRAAE